MKREILISATRREQWVAVLEDGHLAELMFDRPDQGRMVGDIFLGKVEAVLPGIQAAFVDIGTGKAGFLHASDMEVPDDEDGAENERKDTPIQDLLETGEEILVQVTKEPIGGKGPRLTSQISLPGRFLVYMPFSDHVGVSRKIEDREERSRLKELGGKIISGRNGGMIVRTIGEELNRKTFKAEFDRLHSRWEEIRKQAGGAHAPEGIYREAKLVSEVMRDVFSDQFDALTVDSREVYEEIRGYLRSVEPELEDRVHHYGGSLPIFDEYEIEDEIHEVFQPRVRIESGGHIVIEPTEALVSIDVNTGRYTGRGKKDPDETILRTNLDAAREIARQLRLRDVGGIIVIDFIDMESQEHRDRVLHELKSHLGRDRARTKAFEISELGIVEMTRQRVRPSLLQALTQPCMHCGGAGLVYTPPTVVRRIERSLRRMGAAGEEDRVVIRAHPEVALEILESESGFLRRVRKETGLEVDLRDDPLLRQDEFRLLAGPAETDLTSRYTRR